MLFSMKSSYIPKESEMESLDTPVFCGFSEPGPLGLFKYLD